jgi:hypothetical protein
MTEMFGTDSWVDALTLARDGRLAPGGFRAELTNLMRWRLETVLGYKTTMVFKVKNTGGTEIFDMIFATDHEVGEKIMGNIYSRAMQRQPNLQHKARLQLRQKREEDRGVVGMSDLDEIAPSPVQAGVQSSTRMFPDAAVDDESVNRSDCRDVRAHKLVVCCPPVALRLKASRRPKLDLCSRRAGPLVGVERVVEQVGR